MSERDLSAAIKAAEDFSWWNYGLDTVSETESDDWARDLIAEIAPHIEKAVRAKVADELRATFDANGSGELDRPKVERGGFLNDRDWAIAIVRGEPR